MSRPETLTEVIVAEMSGNSTIVNRASALAEMVANARALHIPNADGFCEREGEPWKCATVVALTDSPAPTWPGVA